MYSRQETSQLKKEFWTTFGQYMKPVPTANGETVNWINYKTGDKNIQFRLDADNKSAIVAIEVNHADAGLRELYMDQFRQLEKLLFAVSPAWQWQLHHMLIDGREVSRIYQELKNVNVLNKEDWPSLISFFKQGIMAIDEFWSNAKYAFETLK